MKTLILSTPPARSGCSWELLIEPGRYAIRVVTTWQRRTGNRSDIRWKTGPIDGLQFWIRDALTFPVALIPHRLP